MSSPRAHRSGVYHAETNVTAVVAVMLIDFFDFLRFGKCDVGALHRSLVSRVFRAQTAGVFCICNQSAHGNRYTYAIECSTMLRDFDHLDCDVVANL